VHVDVAIVPRLRGAREQTCIIMLEDLVDDAQYCKGIPEGPFLRDSPALTRKLPYSNQNLCYPDLPAVRLAARPSAAQLQGSDVVTEHPSSPARRLSRRDALLLGGASALALSAAWGLPVLAQRRSQGPAEVPVAELMKPGALPDLVLGKPDAPITVVEYASMTCGHCANFHNKVFPELKQKYIETGKVRFVFREFPLDDRAAAASMIARCAGEAKAMPMVSVLFARQEDWAFAGEKVVPELLKFAKQAGFTEQSFNQCLTDQKLLENVTAIKNRGSETFGVSSTPTFFVNGKRLAGAGTLEDFAKAFAPLLKS
jgi:protein-disulfide isomerase